jgi:hypothetical protein
MNSTKLAVVTVTGVLWLAVACETGASAPGPEPSDETGETGETGDPDPRDDGSTSDDPLPSVPDEDEDEEGDDAEPEPTSACADHGGCFAWCGTRFRDGSCYPSAHGDLDAKAIGPLLCEPLVLDIDDGEARIAAGSTNDDVRCFLQFLRYGNAGVAELYWRGTASSQWAHLVVHGQGTGYAHLEMRLEDAAPACGEAIALSAAAAHVRAERDPLFDACLDTSDAVDITACVLGPAATFYSDHDWVYDVAFPWLTGTCGVL